MSPCPSCGYCPTCGRRNNNTWYPWVPIYGSGWATGTAGTGGFGGLGATDANRKEREEETAPPTQFSSDPY